MILGVEADRQRIYTQGVSLTRLARRTGHDRKTIRYIIRGARRRGNVPLPETGRASWIHPVIDVEHVVVVP